MYIVNISGGQRIKWKLGKPRLEIGGLVCFVVQWKKRCKRSLSEDEIGGIIFYIERNYFVKKKDKTMLDNFMFVKIYQYSVHHSEAPSQKSDPSWNA